MKKNRFLLILFFVCITTLIVNAQEKKIVILVLNNGYSVKGELIEQTTLVVKIKSLDGEIFEYKTDEISNIKGGKLPTPVKIIPKNITKRNIIINLSIGILKRYSHDDDKTIFPPSNVSIEYLITDNIFDGNASIGLGCYLGYASSKNNWHENTSVFLIGPRAYLHYSIIENFDTYVVASPTYNFESYKYTDHTDSFSKSNYKDSYPAINAYAGCRYFFNEKITAMAEVGFGFSIVNIGVAIKL